MKFLLTTFVILSCLTYLAWGQKNSRSCREKPGVQGSGGQYLVRWSYYPDDNRCNVFVYNGGGGNKNNFETQDECVKKCVC